MIRIIETKNKIKIKKIKINSNKKGILNKIEIMIIKEVNKNKQ